MKHILPVFSLFFILIFVTSCDEILEEVVDCIINKRPELSNNKLKGGRNDVFYSEKIWAGIKNEPRDDDFYYDFSYRGDLPSGIDVFFEDREVFFEGTPRETGNFPITISVNVDASYYDENGHLEDPLCENYASKIYTLIIR